MLVTHCTKGIHVHWMKACKSSGSGSGSCRSSCSRVLSSLSTSHSTPTETTTATTSTSKVSTTTATQAANATAGRKLHTDPRFVKHAEPRLLKALQRYGVDAVYPKVTYHHRHVLTIDSPLDFKYDFYGRVEKGYEKMNALLADGLLESDTAEEREVVKCRGKDSNAIDLHICSPKKDQPFIPHTSRTCILHVHGGGMSVLSTMDPIYRATRLRLAEMGFTVIGVEFRNAAGRLGPHRFPAGLNDCLSALDFVYANKKKMNIDKIMLLGESGGANLSLAMALQASQNNLHHMIDGVYALCPYIYGDYNIASKDGSLPSLIENDGLLLPRCEAMHIMSDLYLPDGELPSENPLAWPYHASIEMMEGLPPHVISVNELDPCRDEGLEYCAKLVMAGVVARSRVVKGTCHAGELLFMKYIPDIFASTLNDVNDFAKKLL